MRFKSLKGIDKMEHQSSGDVMVRLGDVELVIRERIKYLNDKIDNIMIWNFNDQAPCYKPLHYFNMWVDDWNNNLNLLLSSLDEVVRLSELNSLLGVNISHSGDKGE